MESPKGLSSLFLDAADSHGLLRVDTAEARGVSRNQLDRLCTRGIIEFCGKCVYRVAGSPDTWQQRVMLGVLATGDSSRASHRCAAAIWGLADGRSAEVIVPKGQGARTRYAKVHDTRHLRGVDVDTRHGIPVTSIERTLVDVAGVLPMGRTARLLDRARSEGLTTYEQVHQRICTMPTRGRRGIRTLRLLLVERIGTIAGESNPFEAMLERLISKSDLPTPQRQLVVQGPLSRYYLDFAFPGYKVAIECDGLLGHASASAQAYDLSRQNDIIEAGWDLRRFTWSDVNNHPEDVIQRVRRALIANGWSPAA
jgi:very-short-patch-repair endonuclease